ncbi:MAG TPA: DUF1236 domain-containing protein [Pseudolabrys sp.]
MTKFLVNIVASVILSATFAANAQTPSQQEFAPAARVNLTLEQRHIIRELIKDLKIEPTKTSTQPSVGDPLPQDVTLRSMPNEIGRKVPQIRAHRFVITPDQIVIVDPKDNRVAELIDLEAN